MLDPSRRLISVADLASALGTDNVTAAKKLARWAQEGWLRRVRRGLYIPVPVDARNPSGWLEDPLVLADVVWAPCYFTGWTAANYWNLTEQIFQTICLKTTNRARSTEEHLLDYAYLLTHVSPDVMTWGLRDVWRDGHRVRMADPDRTVIDILDDPKFGGGIRQCADILDEYLTHHSWRKLVEYGDLLGNGALFKRLGYLAELRRFGDPGLVEACGKRISSGFSLLDPSAPPGGNHVSRWNIRVNVRVGSRETS